MKNRSNNKLLVILGVVVLALIVTVTIAVTRKKPETDNPDKSTTTTTSTTTEPTVDVIIPQEPIENESTAPTQDIAQEPTEEQKNVEVVTVIKPKIPQKKDNTTTTTTQKVQPTKAPEKKPNPTKPTTTTTKVTTTKVTTTKKNPSIPKQKDVDLTKLPNGAKFVDNDGNVCTISIENGTRYYIMDGLGIKRVIPDNYSDKTGSYDRCEKCGREDCGAAMRDWYCVVCKKTIPAHECHDASHVGK